MKTIKFPIFIKDQDETVKCFESYEEIEKEIDYFLTREDRHSVYDSQGQELILNVFLHEVQDLYPKT